MSHKFLNYYFFPKINNKQWETNSNAKVVALSCIIFYSDLQNVAHSPAAKGHLIVRRRHKVAYPTSNPLAVTIPPRKLAEFLATPAKIIRPPTRRVVEDFNLYRNAKRGFKRANNDAFSFPSAPPPHPYRVYTISILPHKLPVELRVGRHLSSTSLTLVSRNSIV